MILATIDGIEDVEFHTELENVLIKLRDWQVNQAFLVLENGRHMSLHYVLQYDGVLHWSGYVVKEGWGVGMLLGKRYVHDIAEAMARTDHR